MAESYLVPAGYGEGRYEDRKSKFIGDLYFVESQEQAIELLNEVKAKYRDARHHCYAYIIREGNYMRYSDDGEPQGTAGMPMLDVLRRSDQCSVCGDALFRRCFVGNRRTGARLHQEHSARAGKCGHQ